MIKPHAKFQKVGITLWTILIISLLPSCSVVRTDYSTQNAKKAMMSYYLPESILKISSKVWVAIYYDTDGNVVDSECTIIKQTFSISTEIVSDRSNMLGLRYWGNPFTADELEFKLNSKGLLETVNVTTDDRTSVIISQLSNAISTPLSTFTNSPTLTKKRSGKVKRVISDSATFEIKGSSILTTCTEKEWNIIILDSTDPKGFITKSGSFTIHRDAVMQSNLKDILNTTSDSDAKYNFHNPQRGILSRPLTNMEVSIKPKSDSLPGVKVNVSIVDVSKIVVVPISRRIFAKSISKIGLQDGVVLSCEMKRPSSAEGLISIPIDVAKAIVSIPNQLISIKIDNTTKKKELEEAKRNLEIQQKLGVDNQKELLKAIEALHKEIERIQKEIADSSKAR